METGENSSNGEANLPVESITQKAEQRMAHITNLITEISHTQELEKLSPGTELAEFLVIVNADNVLQQVEKKFQVRVSELEQKIQILNDQLKAQGTILLSSHMSRNCK
jgi:hypothetical protein